MLHVSWKLDRAFDSCVHAGAHTCDRVLFIAENDMSLAFRFILSPVDLAWLPLDSHFRDSRTEWDIGSHVTTWGIGWIYGFNIAVRICRPPSGYTCRVRAHINWYLMTSAGICGWANRVPACMEDLCVRLIRYKVSEMHSSQQRPRFESHKFCVHRLRNGNEIKRKKMGEVERRHTIVEACKL